MLTPSPPPPPFLTSEMGSPLFDYDYDYDNNDDDASSSRLPQHEPRRIGNDTPRRMRRIDKIFQGGVWG